ncbi:hypothetical protein APS56_16470 [Pseudalgibacter alginicilyticus]|uniref:Uncharacterized protein n=2 Tax=Pseudalgibacter alginicilyticus TaxID=1736674 RepID=A0A0P0DEQ4_9FLAO|nr:hypothetical protein APS56_16470 [Pseudalgibacter alginicilyticus]
MGIFFVLNYESKKRKSKAKSTTVLIIGKVLIVVNIGMFVLINIIFNNSDALKTIENHLKVNIELINEIGQINSIVALPIGTINTKRNNSGESGNATFTLLLKGEKEYKEMSFSAQKSIDTDWRIIDK